MRKDSGINVTLGLGYIAAFARSKGFNPFIIDCVPLFRDIGPASLEKMKVWLAQKILEIKPTLAIGIGPTTLASVKSVEAIDEICKKVAPTTPIVYGGPLASIPGIEWFFFDHLNAFAVVPGDAEFAFYNLLQALKSSQKSHVEGVFYNGADRISPNIIKDLEQLPFPARDLFENGAYFPSVRRDLFASPFASILCSRGCPYKCSYCSSSIIRNGYKSVRSLDNISKEIRTLKKSSDLKSIIFYDDCSFSDESKVNLEVQNFAKMIKNTGNDIVWQIEMRTNIANSLTHESVKVMFDSGCRQINLGIEKGSSKGLKLMGKNISPEQAIEACYNIKTAAPKMRLAGTFIIGGPNETNDEAIETIEFSKKLGLLFAHFYPLEIYPGTDMYYKKFGSDMHIWLDLIQQDTTFSGSLIYEDVLKKREILNLICEAYRSFYRRKDWTLLAKQLLGIHFDEITSSVNTWGESPRW